MKLVMTLKVRDEDDVLEANLRYHLAQGVHFFVVTDNGSVDRTPDILRAYQAAGLLHLIEEPARDFKHRASDWVTRMARMAATDFGADWVLHADADEFWWPVGANLKEMFAAVPDPYGKLIAPRPEFVGRADGPGPFYERLVVREARSRLRPKLAHRARADVRIGRGAHRVRVAVGPRGGARAPRPPGRAVLRAVSAQADADQPALIPAPLWPARILHFPLRSYEQYRRRVEVNLFGGFDETPRRRELRRLYEKGRLPEMYAGLVLDDAEVEARIRDGTLVVDCGLRDFLARCPDPLTQGGAPAPTPPEQDVRAEFESIRLDVMFALARDEEMQSRWRANAKQRLTRTQTPLTELRELRESVRRLESERDRLTARVAALESRLVGVEPVPPPPGSRDHREEPGGTDASPSSQP
ncbi:MAG: glycosyltransferase family 2 protein [Solirubrobacteraceae bacterium]